MRLVKPSATLINVSNNLPSNFIDVCGRICYKSDHIEDPEVWSNFVKARLNQGHESVIEHVSASVIIVCDRGVSHELVRHRIASYSQESTRYCNYKSGHVAFIIPCWLTLEEGIYLASTHAYRRGEDYANFVWLDQMLLAEQGYKTLLDSKWSPQQARSVLPNSLKTELIMTTNLREWRHVFSLRCSKAAHPQMREIMLPLLHDFYLAMPDFFSDLYEKFFGGKSEREEIN